LEYTVYVGNELSILLGKNGLEEEALKQRQELITFCKEHKEYTPIATLYMNLSASYMKKGDLIKVKQQLELAEEMLFENHYPNENRKIRDQYYLEAFWIELYLAIGDISKAKQHYQDLVALKTNFTQNEFSIDIILTKAKYQRAIGNIPKAIELVREHLIKNSLINKKAEKIHWIWNK